MGLHLQRAFILSSPSSTPPSTTNFPLCPSFVSHADPWMCVTNEVEKHVGDVSPIASTNLLSSGDDAFIKMKIQVEKACWGCQPHTVYKFFVWKGSPLISLFWSSLNPKTLLCILGWFVVLYVILLIVV
jgi:hypothetical protein